MNLRDIQALDPEEQRALYYSMGVDTALFAKVVMSHIVTEVPEFHKEIYSMLDDMTQRKYNYSASVIFRGGSKSTLSKTIKSTQDACYSHEPVTMLISESLSQASMDLVGLQDELENNEIIKGLYGNLKGKVWNTENAELSNGSFICVKGSGSRVRGFKWKNQRPTRIVLDDFESEHNTRTAAQRKEVRQWINAQVLPSGTPNTIFQFFGTVVHPNAWLANVQDLEYFQGSKGKFIRYAIEENGVPVWSSRFNKKWIKDKRNFYKDQNLLSLFLQEYYHIPSILGEAAFNINAINELDGVFGCYEHITYVEVNGKKTLVNTFIGVDPASSTSEKADNTVIFVIGVTPDNKIIILDIFADKITTTNQVSKIFEYVRKYRPKHVTVETQGYQLALADWLREKMNLGWSPAFAIREFKSSKSKNNKFIMGLEPLINTGRCVKIKNCNGYATFEKEARAFNGVEKEHDDTLDGFFLAALDMYPPGNFNVDNLIKRVKSGRRKKRKRSYAAF